MEPFRPAVDLVAHRLRAENALELTPAVKAELAGVLFHDYRTHNGATPLSQCLCRLAGSLAKVYLKQTDRLDFPRPLIPLADDGPGAAPAEAA